jgi:hypothetical protein
MATGTGEAVRTRDAERREAHALRLRQVLELRRAGGTYAEIGLAIGISDTAVRKLYRQALKDHYRTAAEEERETALLRCDAIVRRWYPKLNSEDDETADRATRNLLRVIGFQMDLWGYPSRPTVAVEVNGDLRLPTGPEVWQALQRRRAVRDTPLDAVSFHGGGTEGHPFPPPVIARWLAREPVSCDALVQELDYWAHHMAGGPDETYEPRYVSES